MVTAGRSRKEAAMIRHTPAELAALQQLLDQSHGALPRRPVDFVLPSAVRNPYLRQAIDRSRVVLYAA